MTPSVLNVLSRDSAKKFCALFTPLLLHMWICFAETSHVAFKISFLKVFNYTLEYATLIMLEHRN